MTKPLQLLTFKEPLQKQWHRLVSAHEEFQRILRLLLEYDERNERQNLSELHYLRQAISTARAEDLCVYIRDMGGYLFHIVAELKVPGGEAATAWLHEDGIQAERDMRSNQPDHAVHKLFCMSDILKEHSESIMLDENIGETTLKLMVDE